MIRIMGQKYRRPPNPIIPPVPPVLDCPPLGFFCKRIQKLNLFKAFYSGLHWQAKSSLSDIGNNSSPKIFIWHQTQHIIFSADPTEVEI